MAQRTVDGNDTSQAELVSMCAQVRGVPAEPPAGVTFVLPLTSVIEVGNHIAQITDGTVRRTLAQRWQAILQATLDE